MSELQPRNVVKGAVRLFEPHGSGFSAREKRVHARYEIAYTAVDFLAALSFVAGSVMFFWSSWQTPGTWLFLVGSVLFAAKPTIRLFKELALVGAGKEGKV